MSYSSFVLPITVLIFSFYFLSLGVIIITKKRPFLYSAKIIVSLALVLLYSLMFTMSFVLSYKNNNSTFSLLDIFILLALICSFISIWFQTKGYIVHGITDKTFLNAIHYSLKKNGIQNEIQFEEKPTVISLPTLGTDIEVSIQSWMGVGTIELKGNRNPILFKNIISGIKEYFNMNTTSVNYVSAIYSIIAGLFMVAFSALLLSI